ncbi:WD40 repeat domain-containing protein [Streptomyces sp. NPDC091682]
MSEIQGEASEELQGAEQAGPRSVQEKRLRSIASRVFGRLTAPIDVDNTPRWDLASPYLLRHAAEHAAESGQLRRLFQDWEFLVHADPHSVLGFGALLEAETPTQALPVYRASLKEHVSVGPDARRHILAVDAARHQWPDISRRLYHPRHAPPTPWQCRWSTASTISFALRAALAHDTAVSSVATGTVDGWSFAVTTSVGDKVARVWDLTTGTLHHEAHGHTAPLTAVAVGGPHPFVVVTAAEDGILRCWDPRSGAILWEEVAHQGEVREIKPCDLDGAFTLVTYGSDGTVSMRDPGTGTAHQLFTAVPSPGAVVVTDTGADDVIAVVGQGQLLSLDPRTGAERQHRVRIGDSPVTAVAAVHVGQRPAVFVAHADGTGRVFDLLGGDLLTTLNCSPDSMATLAVVDTGADCVAVTGGADGTIRLWELERGGRPLRQLAGHFGEISALAAYFTPSARASDPPHSRNADVPTPPKGTRQRMRHGTERDRRARLLDSLSGYVLLSASADHTLHEWNLADGSLRQTFTAHTDTPREISVADVAGRPVAVSSGYDSTARVWALDDRRAQTAGSITFPLPVNSLTVERVNGRILVAAGCGDERLRVLTTSDGRSEGIHLNGTAKVTAVGLGPTREGPVAVVATDDGRLTARRPETGERKWQRAPSNSPLSVLVVGGSRRRPVVLAVDPGDGARLHVHSLTSGRPLPGGLQGREGVSAVAAGRIREKPVAVIGHHDGAVGLWNPVSGTLRRNLSAAGAGVLSVALGATVGGSLVAAAYDDGRLRVWDAETGRPRCFVPVGHAPIIAVGDSSGRPVVVTASPLGNTIRFWDADTGEPHATVTLPDAVGALSMTEGVLAVGYGRELAVFSAVDNPGPWDDADSAPVAPTRPEQGVAESKERYGRRGGRLFPWEFAVLAHICRQGVPLGLSDLRAAFDLHFNRQTMKAILRSLMSKGLLCQGESRGHYMLTEQGRDRVERAIRSRGLPKRRGQMDG